MRTKYLIILSFVVLGLISCKEDESKKEQMEKRALELAPFLTDNYQEGDSICFLRTPRIATSGEDSIYEKFCVGLSDIIEIATDVEVGIGEIPYKRTDCYELLTSLHNKENTITVFLYVTYESKKVQSSSYFQIGYRQDWDMCRMIEQGDSIHLCMTEKACTLQKNIGIVSFYDRSYSWQLVE